MGLLDAFFPESNEARLARATERLGERQPEYAGPDGAPARLARRIGRRRPHIYAPYDVVSVAHRWRTQVEENAKRLADHGALPEILHNSILAWNAIGSPEARRSAVVLLEPMAGNGTAGLAAGYFADLLKRRRVPVERIRLGLDDRLEAILTGVSFGDHLSLFLAEAEGVDPLEMRAIERMKASLSRTTAEGPARVR